LEETVTKLKARAFTTGAAGIIAALGIALATTSSAQAATATGASGSARASAVQAQSATPHGALVENTVVSTDGTVIAKAATVTPAAAELSPCDVVYWRSTSSPLCYAETYFDGGDPYRWPVTQLDLRAFSNRVWLHQNADGTGWSVCLTGGYDWDIYNSAQDPGNIQVSENTAAC
jgi:hypothetical protein